MNKPRRSSWSVCTASLLALLASACADPIPPRPIGRDFALHPAIAERAMPPIVYAVSDVHGGYTRLTALLALHRIIADHPAAPSRVEWIARDAVLVIVGDLIDKGPDSIDVLDLARALGTSAEASGGAVIVTLGNHEAEFLDDPRNDKAEADDGINAELAKLRLSPESLASGEDPRLAWLLSLPFGARVGRWFFAHAGNTKGRLIAELETALQRGLGVAGYGDPEIVGVDSLLEARGWYEDDDVAARDANAVGADHIVMGHDPNALGARGKIGMTDDAALFRVDCGMSPEVDDSSGVLLRIRTDDGREIAESLASDGTIRELWRAGD